MEKFLQGRSHYTNDTAVKVIDRSSEKYQSKNSVTVIAHTI